MQTIGLALSCNALIMQSDYLSSRLEKRKVNGINIFYHTIFSKTLNYYKKVGYHYLLASLLIYIELIEMANSLHVSPLPITFRAVILIKQ